MKLLKVMLIDAEKLVIDNLKEIIPWEMHGFEIVAETTSSHLAIDLFIKYTPDIVITDIWMPGLNGFDLSKKILSMNNATKIMFLTSYKDIEFAKFTISMGVSNYILKHDLNSQILLNELKKLKLAIQNDQNKRKNIEQHLLKSFVLNAFDLVYGNELKYIYDLNRNNLYSLFLLKIDSPIPFIGNLPNDISDIQKYLNRESLFKSEHITNMEFIQLEDKELIMVIRLKRNATSQQLQETFLKLANEIQYQFKDKTNKSLSIIITLQHLKIEHLHPIYKQLKKLSIYSIFIGKEKVIFLDQFKNHLSDRPINFDLLYNTLRQSVKNINLNLISETINKIFNQIKEPHWNIKALYKVIEDLVFMINTYRQENDQPSLIEEFNNGNLDISQLYSVETLEIWFIKEFSYISKYITNFEMYVYSRTVQKIIKKIKTSYKTNLTIDDIAKELDLNSTYLLQKFKKETDQTFTEYLTNFRVEKAKLLLKNSTLKVYEISSRVGIKPNYYFSSIFEKIVGTTPQEYRDSGD